MPSATIASAASSPATSIPGPSRDATPAAASPRATDDEILGIVSPRKTPTRNADQLEFDFDAAPVAQAILPVPQTATSTISSPILTDADSAVDASGNATRLAGASTAAEPAHLRAAFDANPELRAPGATPAPTANRSRRPTPRAKPPHSSPT
jgi:hypothetical protein